MINWEVILWTCVTIGVLIGAFALVLTFISAKNMKKRRQEMADIHTTLAVGSKVMFAGGIYGKVKDVKEKYFVVEIADGVKVSVDKSNVFAVPAQAEEKK